MLGSTNAYSDYFNDDNDFDEAGYLYKKKLKNKKILFISLISIFLLFIIFSIVAATIGADNNPYIDYDLTERNDFDKDYTDEEVLEEYYPN